MQFIPASQGLTRKLPIALFFLILTLSGLLTAGDYGIGIDAASERNTLRANIHEYAYHLLGPDHPYVVSYRETGYDRISSSTEGDHGQSAYYLATPLLKLETRRSDLLQLTWNAYTWLLFMLGVVAVYGFSREMGLSAFLSCLACLLLYLVPRFFAEAHYNTKDLPLLSLIVATLWLGLRFLKEPGFLRGLVFSLIGAMAANTRIIGILAWGLIGVAAVALRFLRRDWSRRMAGVAVTTVLAFFCFYFLMTPAMWLDPLGFLAFGLKNATRFSRWDGTVLFQGALYQPAVSPLPRTYLPWLMMITLPLYTWPLTLVGQIGALRSMLRGRLAFWQESRNWMLPILSLMWLLPLGYVLVAHPLMYNSWRHFYFVYAGVVLLAGHGLSLLAKWSASRKALRRLATAVVCLCLGASAVGIAVNHPYQYGYYNLLTREGAETQYELDYWEVTAISALRTLYGMKSAEDMPLVISALETRTLDALSRHAMLPWEMKRQIHVTQDAGTPYILMNTTYSIVYGVSPPEGYHVLFEIESYGNTLCTLYEKDQ